MKEALAQFWKMMLIVVGFGGLAAALSSIPSRPATAAGSAPVAVVNTPLPVQGTVAVGNFPATQNVAITGTPTVNANVNFPSTINVANPATAPLFFVKLDEPGRAPYQSHQACTLAPLACVTGFPAAASGHRLVITHISGSVAWSPAMSTAFVIIPGRSTFFTPFAPIGVSVDTAFDRAILLYYDAGESPELFIDATNGTSQPLGGNVFISGYLLDCNVAPCAAIAQ